MHNDTWTLAEYAILCQLYESEGAEHCAALLGRTLKAVECRLRMLLRMDVVHTYRKPAGLHANIEANRLARARNTARIEGCALERWEASRKRRYVYSQSGPQLARGCHRPAANRR